MSFLGLAKRYNALRIDQRIAALVLACILPAWLFIGYLTLASYQDGRRVLEQSLLAATQTQLRVVEREIAATEAALQALATSPALDDGNYQRFHAQAQEMLRLSPHLNIVLLDPDGRQVVNTLQPFGQPLPNKPGAFFFRVRETGKPVLSDLFIGPVTGRPLAALAVPVLRGGRLVNVLTMSFDTEHLTPVLNQEGYPDTWAAAIFDVNGTIVARTWEPEKYVGRKAGAAFFDPERATRRRVVETTTLEGIPVLAAYSQSERYGWTVSFAVPKAIMEADLKRSLWLSLIAGAVLLLAGLALARRIGRGIIRPIQALIPPAMAIGQGIAVPAVPLDLNEAEEVRRALADAAALIQRRTVERDQARLRELETQIQHRALRALNDIAALPGADAARQLVETLRLGARHFGLPLGIVSRVEGSTYTILHHCAPEDGLLADGQHVQLDRTCCALTLERDDVVAIPPMPESPPLGHPGTTGRGLGAYVGAPVHVRGRSFGTVNFSSAEPLGREFDDGDREFMRLLARWVGSVLERQLSDGEIAAARLELERSNEDLERFAFVASHDLRQPLRMVISYLTLIERRLEGRLDDEDKVFLHFAVDGAARMNRMILDLLEYSRIGRDPEKTPVNLAGVAEQAERQLADAITEAGAEIVLPPSLPTVVGNESEMVRLFQNLIGNAVKFRAPGRPPRVAIACDAADGEWIISVADNGIGIAPEDFDRLFAVFQRLGSREQFEGTGIGLATVQRIVRRHGGLVWAQSEVEKGATFWFTLPAPEGPWT